MDQPRIGLDEMTKNKQTDDRVQLMIRVSPAMHEQLKHASYEHEASMTALVVRAVDYYLPRLLPADQIQTTRDI